MKVNDTTTGMKRGFPILALATAVLLCFALYQDLAPPDWPLATPNEQTMGYVQRIFYYHVSSAWTGMLMCLINFAASIVFLRNRSQKADIVALVAAELGLVFGTVVLVTGPIWARPVWGIWWEPADIRLNSTLALWLIYMSYLMLRRFSTSSKVAVIAAVWAIFGALDVPFVFFSIWFFRTQHPSPVIAQGGHLDARFWVTVFINWAA
ncbi:MAG: cytochrome c biogenesis protein CcsA, partial [Acidobacteria bacterium]|nr:cytochrome c biogenesis protein CcsA [Acidobacteriota bacterium]